MPEYNVKNTCWVPVTGDKGLCGACNSGVVREIKKTLGKDPSGGKIIVIGDKGSAGLARPYPNHLKMCIS